MHDKKICILNSYPICPPRSGGQVRIYQIAKNLAKNFDVNVLTTSPTFKSVEEYRTDNLLIKNIPQFSFLPGAFFSRMLKIPIGESIIPLTSKFAFKFKKELKEIVKSSDILISERPYLFNLIEHYKSQKLIVYSSHDVEITIKDHIYSKNPYLKKNFLPLIRKTEKSACKKSDIILTPSKADKEKLSELYGISLKKIHVAPNGVDVSKIRITSEKQKNEAKKKLGLEKERILLFIGSQHPPNILAANHIMAKIAPKLNEYKFLILGDIGKDIKNSRPNNVEVTGFVDDKTKYEILKATDIALNPITYGSGTNLKLLEYLAAGLPTITTSVGARGIELENHQNIIISEIYDFIENIRFLFDNEDLMEKIGKNGRELIEEKYNWQIISKGIENIFKKFI